MKSTLGSGCLLSGLGPMTRILDPRVGELCCFDVREALMAIFLLAINVSCSVLFLTYFSYISELQTKQGHFKKHCEILLQFRDSFLNIYEGRVAIQSTCKNDIYRFASVCECIRKPFRKSSRIWQLQTVSLSCD